MTQTEHLYELLKDGLPHRTDEIADKIYSGGSLARVSARINDLANGKWPGTVICHFVDAKGNEIGRRKGESKGWHDSVNPSLYWYRMQLPRKIELAPAFESKTTTQTLF